MSSSLLSLRIILVLFSITLASCSVRQVVHNPIAVPSDQLVKVRRFDRGDKFFGNVDYGILFRNVWDEAGNEVESVDSYWDSVTKGPLEEITLAPGKYRFKALCFNTGLEARPEAVFELEASKSYEIYCEILQESYLEHKVDKYAKIKIRELVL